MTMRSKDSIECYRSISNRTGDMGDIAKTAGKFLLLVVAMVICLSLSEAWSDNGEGIEEEPDRIDRLNQEIAGIKERLETIEEELPRMKKRDSEAIKSLKEQRAIAKDAVAAINRMEKMTRSEIETAKYFEQEYREQEKFEERMENPGKARYWREKAGEYEAEINQKLKFLKEKSEWRVMLERRIEEMNREIDRMESESVSGMIEGELEGIFDHGSRRYEEKFTVISSGTLNLLRNRCLPMITREYDEMMVLPLCRALYRSVRFHARELVTLEDDLICMPYQMTRFMRRRYTPETEELYEHLAMAVDMDSSKARLSLAVSHYLCGSDAYDFEVAGSVQYSGWTGEPKMSMIAESYLGAIKAHAKYFKLDFDGAVDLFSIVDPKDVEESVVLIKRGIDARLLASSGYDSDGVAKAIGELDTRGLNTVDKIAAECNLSTLLAVKDDMAEKDIILKQALDHIKVAEGILEKSDRKNGEIDYDGLALALALNEAMIIKQNALFREGARSTYLALSRINDEFDQLFGSLNKMRRERINRLSEEGNHDEDMDWRSGQAGAICEVIPIVLLKSRGGQDGQRQ
jgi:hypothetical protein